VENDVTEPRILGVTLARGGSKNVPRKNIRPVLGQPLIAYTICEALRCQRLTRYLVSSDDDEIRAVARAYGAEAPFRRPADLADDTATSEATLAHAVLWAEQDEGRRYDYVVELMVTGPLKTVEDIDAVLDKLLATGADSVIAVHPVEAHHPARMKKIVDDRLVDFCVPEPIGNRRQDLRPLAYVRSSSIYAMKRDVLVVQGRRYGTADSRPYILPPERTVGVDTELDMLVVEALLQQSARDYVRPVASPAPTGAGKGAR
jgi:CMP-N-acetylneuraminic acid synthetase